IQESYGFLGETFDREEKVTRKFTPETKYVFSHKYGKTRRAYSDAFADAYHKEVGGMVAFRLKQAPTLVSSLWLTAWKDAGSPNLNELLGKKPSKVEKDSLAAQLKVWKDNGLVGQQMLIALRKEKAAAQADQINAATDMAPVILETEEPAPATAAPATPAAGATGKGPDKVKVKTKTEAGNTKTKQKEQEPSKKDQPKKQKGTKQGDGWGNAPAGSGW
ncbi:MAG TPA: hypothetical protein VK364_11890, partial [Hymenobacter sp.]|nr:hypothetical protein [Hymenobacter sp.]